MRTPAFIVAVAHDEYPLDDGVQRYAAWRKAGAPAERHVYEHGGHGFELAPKGATSDHWFDALICCMQSRDLLGRRRIIQGSVGTGSIAWAVFSGFS